MSRWIETEDGHYVNLSHVVRAVPITRKNRWGTNWTKQSLTLVDGSRVVTAGGLPERDTFEELIATVLPSQPGQEALLVDWDHHSERPTELWIDRYPVLGWRLPLRPNEQPTPILPENSLSRELMIVLPGGRILAPRREAEFADLETMQRAVLADAQADWDAANVAKDAADRADAA